MARKTSKGNRDIPIVPGDKTFSSQIHGRGARDPDIYDAFTIGATESDVRGQAFVCDGIAVRKLLSP